MSPATLAVTSGIEVVGHPMPARDAIESRTFARDLLYASFFSIHPNDLGLWLLTRARSRRDLLWFCRNVKEHTRLSEEKHRPAADFVSRIVRTPHSFGNLRDSRGNGKTTLATIDGSMWCAVQDPIECIERGWPIRGRESRLGITTLRSEFTSEFMQLLLDDLNGCEKFRWAFPELIPVKPTRWGQKRITLRRGLGDFPQMAAHPLFVRYPRTIRFPDPTFAAGSLEAGRAGAHTNGEFIDDPVNEKTWNSPPAIRTAIHAIRQLYMVSRTEIGFRLVIGNHWCPGDVAETIDLEDANWEVFMRSGTACDVCKDGYPVDANGVPPRDEDGLPWQHKHVGRTYTHLMPEADGSEPDLTRVRRSLGSFHLFSAQIENTPLAPGSTLWGRESLGEFGILTSIPSSRRAADGTYLLDRTDVITYHDKERVLQRCTVGDLSLTVTLDPAHGSTDPRASQNAITVLGRTPADTFLLLYSWAHRLDEPLEVLNELICAIKRFHLRKIGIESVAFQKVLCSLLIRELDRNDIGWVSRTPRADIVPIPRDRSGGAKETAIRDGLGPLITRGDILVNLAVAGTREAVMQVEGFPIRKPWDTLDSLTMHSFLWQRVPRSPAARRQIAYEERKRKMMRRRKGGKTGYGW